MAATIKKHYIGCYRVTYPDAYEFGQIKHEGRNWLAEIRDTETGRIVRFAGIWKTKHEAIEECEFILNQ